nr:hypothetical protein [Tanacetum cinerariifolium]
MQPRLERTREVTPLLRTRSPKVHRQRKSVVGFKEAPNRERSRIGRNIEGNRPLEARAEENGRREINLPPLLAAHLGRNKDGQPSQSSLTSGAIRMQKWQMLVACHMFTYTLKDSARIWWNSKKECSILNYKDLKAKFRSHFSQQKRFTKMHLAVQSIKQRKGESVRAFATRYTDDTLQILGLHEDQRIFGFIHGVKARNLVEHLSTYLPSTYKGLMEKTYTWIEAREFATNGALNDHRDNSKSPSKSSKENLSIEKLRIQIKEAVRSCQLSHIVKGIKKERTKTSDSQRGEKKEKRTTTAETHILMRNQEEARTRNNISKNTTFEGREIKFPLVTKGSNSSALVIIKAKIFRREVGRVDMDSGSSCEVIYEHCFLKMKPSIQAFKVDSQVPLVGFLREKSWAIGEVLLEIMIGNAPLTRSETLNFIIVRSNSPYNMPLGRTAMQKIGMYIFSLRYRFRNPFSSTTMADENPIQTLGDYSKPSHEGYMNTIELPVGNNMVPLRSDTIRLVQNGCSFYGLLSKFESDFKQQQSEMTNKIDTMLKAITDRIEDMLSVMVKNPKLGATLVLPARSYPTVDPQCSSHPSNSINDIKTHFKETIISQTSLQQPEIEIEPLQPEEPKTTLEDEF